MLPYPYSYGNGLDVVDSRLWKQYNHTENYVFITATPKSKGKVTLFAQVNYDEQGQPVKSVLEQGSKRPELIDMLREVYSLHIVETEAQDETGETEIHDTLFLDKNYVDLEVHIDSELPVATNIFYLPKTISRLENKGKLDYVRREGNTFYPLTVVREQE